MPRIPADPHFPLQLHLRNPNTGQVDINVTTAWDDYTGEGVQVTVIDGGFDLAHGDLDGNFRTDIDYDYSGNDFNPDEGAGTEAHGTPVAGIIGAEEGNGFGGVGIAWDADLVAFKRNGFGYEDAGGLGNGIGNTNGDDNGSDVINGSFGYATNFVNFGNLSGLDLLVDHGRGGLGANFVKSNGNSRDTFPATTTGVGMQATAVLENSTQSTVSVAALRLDGWVARYSTPGANTLISAFGDDVQNRQGVYTTDRLGVPGYNDRGLTNDFTHFSGTSAAAPIVSGVVALMMEANPDLGWRDVQTILAYSARHVGSDVDSAANTGQPIDFSNIFNPIFNGYEAANQPNGSSWYWNDARDWNGGALHFSNDYGFGLVDATAAVRLAETWGRQSISENQLSFSIDVDGALTGKSISSIPTTYSASLEQDIIIENVSLNLNFRVDDINDATIYLISPDGTRVEMLRNLDGSSGTDPANFLTNGWDFGTTAFMGTVNEEDEVNTWQVEVTNRDGLGAGSFIIDDADLTFIGRPLQNDDVYIFTNEYSDYASGSGHATLFQAGAVGVNNRGTINAAAVTSNTTLNFLANSGTIDGVAITAEAIAAAYTGDGNDTVTGDGVTTLILTGRGNDLIIGGNSAGETLNGGPGNDNVDGGPGNDTIIDGVSGPNGANGDTQGTDTIAGGADNDLIIANWVTGGTYAGGTGTDTLDVRGDGSNFSVSNSLDLGGVGGSFTAFGATFTGFENVWSGGGNDRLIGSTGDNEMVGGRGNDDLYGSSGSDVIHGDDFPFILLALNTDGASEQYAEVTNFTDMPTENFTVEWLYRGDASEASSQISFVSYAVPNSTDEFLVFAANGVITVSVNGVSINTGVATSTVVDGDVHRMSVSVNTGVGADGRISLYVDGVEEYRGAGGAGTSGGGVAIASGGTLILGQDQDGTTPGGGFDLDQQLVGEIGDIRVWNTERDADDISALAFTRLEDVDLMDQRSLVANWQLDYSTRTFDNIAGTATMAPTSLQAGATFARARYDHDGGNDTLDGGTDDDTIFAGGGNDLLYAGYGSDVFFGGEGTDTYQIAGSAVDATDIPFLINLLDGFDNYFNTYVSIENVNAGVANDEVIGNAGVNVINGGAGDDTVEGGAGADILQGGADINTVSYASSDVGVLVVLGNPTQSFGHAQGDSLSGFANIIGSVHADTLDARNGDAGNSNVIRGGGGADFILARDGTDAVYGDDGDDRIWESSADNAANEFINGGEDNDTYEASASGVSTTNLRDDTIISVETLNVFNGNGADLTIQLNASQLADNFASFTADARSSGSAIIDIDMGGETVLSLASRSFAGFDQPGDLVRVTGGASADSITGSSIRNVISGGGDNDTLRGGAQDDTVEGGADDDVLDGGPGADRLDGGSGRDAAQYSDAAVGVLADLMFAGDNTGDAAGDTYVSIESLVGSTLGDDLRGDDDDNTLSGDGDNDTLVGRGGNDTLNGEGGDDSVIGGFGADSLEGGSGSGDTVSYVGEQRALTVNLETGQGDAATTFIELTGGSTTTAVLDEAIAGNIYINVHSTTHTGGELRGQVGAVLSDETVGTIRTVVFSNIALSGANEVPPVVTDASGMASLTMIDEGGTVTYDIRMAFAGLTAADITASHFHQAAAGVNGGVVENILAEAAATLTDGVESDQISGFENIIGGTNGDSLTGDGAANRITSGAGADTLDGGAGTDEMIGETGDDTYHVDSYSDVVTELEDEGSDTIETFLLSYSIFSLINIENLTGLAITNQALTGNTRSNVLTGNADGNDTLVGSSGDDTLVGLGGNDRLEGGTGANDLRGGAGDDIYVVSSFGDVLTEAAGAGIDTVLTALGGYSIFTKAHVENITSTTSGSVRLTGNTLDNELTGNGAGNDTLVGSSGDDTLVGLGGNDRLEGGTGANDLRGGAGDDIYVVSSFGDVLTEAAGAGIDTVLTALGGYSIFTKANVENITSTTSGSVRLTGNTLDNVLTGNGAGNDTLVGSSGDDTLVGLGGNDRLEGGTGANDLRGGAGDDIYVVSSFGDVLTEAAGAGIDTVLTALGGYSIFTKANVENITSTTSGSVRLTGNTLDNVLTGNGAGNDTLVGSSGDDTLVGLGGNDRLEGGTGANDLRGGAGDDTYVVSSFGDVLTEAAGAGIDTVLTALGGYSIFTKANVENITSTTSGSVRLTGNTLDNVLTGNGAGNDTLVGSSGDDTLVGLGGNDRLEGGTGANDLRGGAGDDTYVVSSFGDVLTEAAGAGIDTVLTALGGYSIFTKANVENITSTTSGSVRLTGNTLDNVLTGNGAGSDTLVGSSGNDTLVGLGGNDRLEGGAGLDVFIFNTAPGAGNIDQIADFSVADDTFHLDNAVFTALGTEGALSGSAFHLGAAAVTAAHHVIYNSISGALFHDADGAGGAAQLQIANLDAGLALTSADFFVI